MSIAGKDTMHPSLTFVPLAALVVGAPARAAGPGAVELLNASYDPTRELNQAISHVR